MIQLNLLHYFDTFNRILVCKDTFLAQIAREALDLARFEPRILTHLQHDIEGNARQAKKERLMDDIFEKAQLPRFPEFVEKIEPSDFASVNSWTIRLDQGRSRAVDAELLLVLIVMNGVFSLTSREGYNRLVESEVFNAALQAKGVGVPARSTVGKYLELPSERTHRVISDALYRKVAAEELDDFSSLTVDSTGIEANSAWPTESKLIFGFLQRIDKLLHRQASYTGVAYECKLVDRWLQKLENLHKSINLLPVTPGIRKKRRKLYNPLLETAEKTRAKLRKLLDNRFERITECCIRPSDRLRVDRMLEHIDTAFQELDKAMDSARRRVIEDEHVPAEEKTFSLADPDAYMIKKGSRDPLVGYKPQIGRSAEGFISCFEVQRGNPADSKRLEPMVRLHQKNTSVTPFSVSTDDGYSSGPNLDALTKMHVQQVSFSGAKGRKILGEETYRMPEYENMRNDRSAVESSIFTFKHKCNMRRFCRHGLAGVRKDMAEAVLAYNLWRMAYVRNRRYKEGMPIPKAA
ncbi:MAG: transposase [Verrucomicrobiota bacterium]